MIDHLGIQVSDYQKAKDFYLKALAPLGIGVVMEVTAEQSGSVDFAGLGKDGNPFFWFGKGDPVTTGVHIAFTAANRAEVDAFYETAMAAGAKDNGGPGLRPHYHPDYYGAFVFDLDGNNVEAVCHTPE